MPEAEDVLIAGAERAAEHLAAVRRRRRGDAPAPGTELAEAAGRIALFVEACTGRAWPIRPCDPAQPTGWIERLSGRASPWADVPAAVPFTDGHALYLPRRLDLGDRARELALLRTMALLLACRAGEPAPTAADPVARDLAALGSGLRAEATIARAWPGLAADVERARAIALSARPAPRRASALERAVEEILRERLAAASPAELPADPDALARRASSLHARWPGPYRGIAPALHWGVVRPPSRAARATAGEATEAEAERGRSRRRPSSRSLGRRVEGHDPEEEDAGAGVFVMPFGDPELAMEDASGLERPADSGGDEDLDALASELERLGEVTRVRDERAVSEILVGDDAPREGSPDATEQPTPDAGPGTRVYAYPEWEATRDRYLPAHCLVHESEAPQGDPEWAPRVLAEHRAALRRLRREFEALKPQRVRHRRQVDGPELDLDAYVEAHADRTAGLVPSDRLYALERPLERDVAVLFLLDVSGSTDGAVIGAARVIDLVREGALLLGEALQWSRDRAALLAFSGRGPRGVRVTRLRSFGEPHGDAVRRRIASLAPDRSTRLGAAIRHASAELAREPARLRLLFLLSDGKPSDDDRYEGRHGREDTRQAVLEARQAGLRTFCLAIDRHGAEGLDHLFGASGHAVLWSMRQLPERLPEIYRGLTLGHRA